MLLIVSFRATSLLISSLYASIFRTSSLLTHTTVDVIYCEIVLLSVALILLSSRFDPELLEYSGPLCLGEAISQVLC